MCGRPGSAPDGPDAPLCPNCRAGLSEGVVLRITAPAGSEPELRFDDRVLRLEAVSRLLGALDGQTLSVQLAGPEPGPEVDAEPELSDTATDDEPALGPSLPLSTGPLAPLRDPLDEEEADSWAEAVGLLEECLGANRAACPLEALRLACAAARDGLRAARPPWPMVADAAGWGEHPPADDRDLWTAAVMALASVAVDTMEPKMAACLDAMEADDWLATVLELVRSGAGTAADVDALVALSARCLDVDSAAVDPVAAAAMAVAFEAVLPVWRAAGVVDRDGTFTALGVWGLPHALARAWAGSLRT
ncbi:MAG: hypothetical protein NVS3B12_34150 [Acidimicrobiales bacterium]